MPQPRVAVVFGSDSDWDTMESCIKQLREFGETPFVEVMSAHRNPQRCSTFASAAEESDLEVIIAAAGMSNALAGAIAAHTTLPVIGVPLVSGSMQGMDALLSTVQMPPGIPVATVSVGRAGAKNAALLAIQILARKDEKLASAFREFKKTQADAVAGRNAKVQEKL